MFQIERLEYKEPIKIEDDDQCTYLHLRRAGEVQIFEIKALDNI